MKWIDCNDKNKEFTGRYDAAARKVRKKLGSYDTISHLIFREIGVSVAGVSVRRWFLNRNLPINYATVIVDLMEGGVSVADFHPYLEPYFDDDFLA